ncbi:MAG: PqqD family protein [Mariprofundaceae bacterium]
MPDRPKKIDGLESEELEGLDEVVYVRRDDGSCFSLNPTASVILDLCNGQRTCEDIMLTLQEDLTVEKEQLLKDIEAILTEFNEYGLTTSS